MEALESAHDHNIIHRDLKPSNIKIRPDGTVKVLDFGLAKEVHSPSELPPGSIANSPTMTTPAMSHLGIVLGTAPYMSPEQAKGRVVDRRADIWAFGCVLFEILTGQRAFGGTDVSDILVSILRDEPNWSALPSNTPPYVRSLLRRCLEKDVRKRLPHIGVARLEFAESTALAPDNTPGERPRPRSRAVTVAAIVLTGALAVALWTIWPRTQSGMAPPIHVRIEPGTPNPVALVESSALSPDGTLLAFVGRPPDDLHGDAIYLRHLDRLDAEALSGTEKGRSPFFSPDGKWIAFFADGTLKKVPTGGGPVISLCPTSLITGGWWGDDGGIVFASAEGLRRVAASGGEPSVIAAVAPGRPIPSAPQVLPRGRGVLYSEGATRDAMRWTVMVQDLAGGPAKPVVRGGIFPRYVASGHLTFVRNGALFAVPFDLDTLQPQGEPVAVIDGIVESPAGSSANVAISANGMLAYEPATAAHLRQAAISWLTRTGPLTPLRTTPASFTTLRFSPDGKRLAMSIVDGRECDIWVYDLERDILTRITTDPAADLSPVWTPDGTGLVFGSARGSGVLNLFWQRADGTGTAERLTTSAASQLPDSIDPEGKLVLFLQGDPNSGRQLLGIVPLQRRDGHPVSAGAPTTLIDGPSLLSYARLSPDGKWIAYASNESGVFQVYVQPFPGLGQRVQVSNAGGRLAVWSPTKNELYFADAEPSRLMAVSYSIKDGTFVPEKPRPWSEAQFSPFPPYDVISASFDIHPDGERFAVTPVHESANANRGGQFVLVSNFFDELRRVAPHK